MKLSEIKREELPALPYAEKFAILERGICDDGQSSDYALLLGTKPQYALERALAAAALYRAGRTKFIVPSGGVEWDLPDGRRLSEALYMKEILMEQGVPESAILLENEATTTRENMIYGVLQINRHARFKTAKRVAIVTSRNHMKRSLALAKAFLPRMAEISSYPAEYQADAESRLASEVYRKMADTELRLLKDLVTDGIAEDFEL